MSRDDDKGYWRLLERIVVVYGLLLAIALGVGIYAWSALHDSALTEAHGGNTVAEVLGPPPAPPRPEARIDGTKARAWLGPEGGMERGIVWASELVERSSQYTPTKWNAQRALGPPDVHPERTDHPRAWASQEKDRGPEWITVRFPGASEARAVVLVETLHPGAVARVDDVTDPDEPVELWRTPRSPVVAPGHVLLLELATPRPITTLRVLLDTARVAGWNEIDAVGLLTEDVPEATEPPPSPTARRAPEVHETLTGATAAASPALPAAVWAGAVLERTSEYSTGAWSAARTLGPPDVWPAAGDSNRAWAQDGADTGFEWVTVQLPRTRADAVVVVETFRPGAIVRVDDVTDPDRAVALWEGPLASDEERRALVVRLPEARELEVVRVVLDTRLVEGWNELDAIGLVAARP